MGHRSGASLAVELGYAENTDDVPTATSVDIPGVNFTITGPVLLVAEAYVFSDAVGGYCHLQIQEGATTLRQAPFRAAVANELGFIHCECRILAPAPGPHVYKVVGRRDIAGTAHFFGVPNQGPTTFRALRP